jgi:D-proline reductase (dithiol) PrdB
MRSDADPDDAPVRYIARTHAWYGALGYGNPYRYAQHSDAPFTPLAKPLAAARVALLTTAAPYRPELGDQGAGAPYNAAAKFYEVYSGDTATDHDLRVSHVAVDQVHLSDDQNCWFPLPALRRASARGRVGGLTARFHGVPTNRSRRHTTDVDAPELVRRCREDGADAAILVANCPVCHQSMSLVARALEAAGVATVVMGAAKDIVELCGVPRFLFSDAPLGNAAGLPWDVASQDAVLEEALALLENARGPRTTAQGSLVWPTAGWKRDYMNLDVLTPAEIARLRAENEAARIVGQRLRDAAVDS